MFILGLIVGPALGLFVNHLLLQVGGSNHRVNVLILALCVAFLLFAGFIPLPLKLGVLTGGLLGFLLSVTPTMGSPHVDN